MLADITFRQSVAEPTPGRAHYLHVLGPQTQLLAKLPIKRLLRAFMGLDAALRKLPGVLPDTTRPQYLTPGVGQDDADIRPKRYIRKHCSPTCIGQKQVWFLLRLVSLESAVKLDACRRPEFDSWKWVNYWHPSREVIFFKREVYRRALKELAPMLYGDAQQCALRTLI